MEPPNPLHSHSKPRSPSVCRFLQTCKCISLDDVSLPSRRPLPHTLHDRSHAKHAHSTIQKISAFHSSSFQGRSLRYPPSRIWFDGEESSMAHRFLSDGQKNLANLDPLACHLQGEDSCKADISAHLNRIDLSDKDEETTSSGSDGGSLIDVGRRQKSNRDGGDRLCKDCLVRVSDGEHVNSCCCCCCKGMGKARVLQASEDPWVPGDGGRLARATPNLVMGYRRILEDCVLREKYSYQVCEDFYNSMLEIVILKKIIDMRDLKKLLACYFSINPPIHHDLIEQAFVNLLTHVFLDEVCQDGSIT